MPSAKPLQRFSASMRRSAVIMKHRGRMKIIQAPLEIMLILNLHIMEAQPLREEIIQDRENEVQEPINPIIQTEMWK